MLTNLINAFLGFSFMMLAIYLHRRDARKDALKEAEARLKAVVMAAIYQTSTALIQSIREAGETIVKANHEHNP